VKRGFIRALYGIFDKSNRILAQRYQITKDIDTLKTCEKRLNSETPFVAYVYGEQNYKELTEKGFNCVLFNKEPFQFDLSKHCHRHKLEIIQHAMTNDGYDELVFLDWDCIPQRKIPNNFWEELGRGEPFRACLQQYRKTKCPWRNQDRSIVPNGGFVYFRGKDLIQQAVKLWDVVGQPDNEEITYAKLIDEINGGWIGVQKYFEKYEAPFCNLRRGSPIKRKLLDAKPDISFIHYHG
jgi:hypothetical protein